MIDYYDSNIDLTLLGCGFLDAKGTYHIGAIYLLTQIWPHSPFNRICGSSCGGVLGALIVAGISLEKILEQAIGIVNNTGYLIRTGSFLRPEATCSFRRLIERQLDGLMPEDAHAKCTGKLGLSISELMPLKNNLVSVFLSRQDLIEAISAGCFIPFWSGELWPPIFRGRRCLDGAYTNNRPKFELAKSDIEGQRIRQVEVCPFNSKIDVSPEVNSFSFGTFKLMDTVYHLTWANFCRMIHAMVPCSAPIYRGYLFHGYKDMKDYLIRNKLIVCRDCYNLKQQQKHYEDCYQCSKLVEQVTRLRLPERVCRLIS